MAFFGYFSCTRTMDPWCVRLNLFFRLDNLNAIPSGIYTHTFPDDNHFSLTNTTFTNRTPAYASRHFSFRLLSGARFFLSSYFDCLFSLHEQHTHLLFVALGIVSLYNWNYILEIIKKPWIDSMAYRTRGYDVWYSFEHELKIELFFNIPFIDCSVGLTVHNAFNSVMATHTVRCVCVCTFPFFIFPFRSIRFNPLCILLVYGLELIYALLCTLSFLIPSTNLYYIYA